MNFLSRHENPAVPFDAAGFFVLQNMIQFSYERE